MGKLLNSQNLKFVRGEKWGSLKIEANFLIRSIQNSFVKENGLKGCMYRKQENKTNETYSILFLYILLTGMAYNDGRPTKPYF